MGHLVNCKVLNDAESRKALVLHAALSKVEGKSRSQGWTKWDTSNLRKDEGQIVDAVREHIRQCLEKK